jgi:pimeloyl-ACP methyl ester carboxylesterase
VAGVVCSRDPTQKRLQVNGIELVHFEWGAGVAGRDPTILFVHATGFHARVWDQVIGLLGERHVIAVDQRGHGRSQKLPIEHWRAMGEDLAELARVLGLEAAIGVGHSMGGHAIVDAAAAVPTAFQRLLIIDPVIASPEGYTRGGWRTEQLEGQLHPTAKRKNHFHTRDEMFERFKRRRPYSVWEPATLRDYCEHGLRPCDDGGYVLACPPEIEASVYMSSRSNPGVHDSIHAPEMPVTILRAREASGDGGVMDFSSSPTWPGLIDEFPNGREVYLPDHTHFIPMQDSALVARYVRDAEAAASG